MEERNKGLIIFGIVLLAIGLVASFYHDTYRDIDRSGNDYGLVDKGYPYQTIGIVLAVAGIVFVALGLLYPTRKTPPPPSNPQQQKTNQRLKGGCS